MGISCKENLICKLQNEFHAIDKLITGYAFDVHNSLGRFCDEKIYQETLVKMCQGTSINAKQEVEITLTYKDFSKIYKLDLLIDDGIIYELKTVISLNDSHKQQLINYLLLTGINHGKLMNFRPASVEYNFVSTTLKSEHRYDYLIDSSEMSETTKKCKYLRPILSSMLCEWGAFLDINLYNEALIHFLGGADEIIRPVEIIFNRQVVGEQKMQLLNNNTVFHISSIQRAFKGYEKNIRNLIEHTRIKNIQWINFNQNKITIKTIKIK